ncbi:farnesyltranstransferase [Mycena galopus ATCC 62051]|nr:farnesyltranstransferase [Mycena galopus ATCC 62051]
MSILSQEIFEPFTYIAAQPGKNVGRDMIHALNFWIKAPEDKVTIISTMIDTLHNASLMLDDVEDNSKFRRGRPATHRIFGIPQTVNTATYVLLLAHQELSCLAGSTVGYGDLVKILVDELIRLHHGQGLDLLWRDSVRCPTEAEYIEMAKDKTGGLLRMGVRLLTAFSETPVEGDYISFVNLVAVYYQIRDDFMNLRSSVYTATKGFAEDLEEGKFSFPIVHAVQMDTKSRQIINVLQQRPTTPTLKEHIIDCLDKMQAFEYTLSILDGLQCEIRKGIQDFGANEALSRMFDALHVDAKNFR